MNAFAIAATGAIAATDRFSTSAQKVASGQGDLASEAVSMASDRQTYDASLAVLHVSDEMTKQLLDIKV
jgi:flagellar basal body rod protein FlgC